MKIIHIADVHFRGLSRHDEYRETFQNFFDIAKEVEPDVIYVGGDIVHSKTQGISPELIEVLVWWFKGMAEIAPVHVILGNHDGLLLNLDRQDAITPIVEAINSDRIHLYKDSGVYPTGHDGINWCVFSCFDETGWKNVIPVEDEVNIALFHGSVDKAETDLNWALEGDVKLDFFRRFDYTLLGDIHKRQFLDKSKKIAYSGSTIPQDYSEHSKKGFLLWDIRDKDDFDVEFYHVPHNKPFVTIDWQGSVTKTLEKASDYPAGARFRIKLTEPVPQKEITQIRNSLRTTHVAEEVVTSKTYQEPVVTNLNVDFEDEDLLNYKTHISLFQEYVKDENLSKSEWEDLKKLIYEYVKVASKHEDLDRNVKWSVDKMKFNNTFAYGKDNEINFKKLRGITGIFGRNRRGKSSLIGTLMFGMFNTTDRGSMRNVHIINTRYDYCNVELDISTSTEKFRVERQAARSFDRKNNRDSSLTSLNFWKLDNNGEIIEDLSEDQRRTTENRLRKKFGEADEFLMTSFASQGEMNRFIKEGATSRKSILTKFLGLDIFDKMHHYGNEDAKQIKSSVKNMPDRDWDTIIKEYATLLSDNKEKTKEYEQEILKLKNKLDESKHKLTSFKNADIVTQSDVERQKDSAKILENKIKSTNDAIDKLIKAKTNLIEKTKSIKKFVDDFNIEETKEQIEEYKDVNENYQSTNHSLEKEEQKFIVMKKSVKRLSEVPCGDEFPMCKFIKASYENKVNLDEQKERVDSLAKQRDILKSILDKCDIDKLESNLYHYDKIREELSKTALKVNKLDMEIHTNKTNLDSLKERLDRSRMICEDLESRVVDGDVDQKLSALKNQVFNLESEIKEIEAKKISCAREIGKLSEKKRLIKAEKKKYKKLRQQWKLYQIFLRGVSKRGIPTQIIMSKIPRINSEIKKILENVVSFTVELTAPENGNDMDILLDYGDSKRVIEVCSGMEKMISSLAIRVALINIATMPKTDMLIIDEGFGSLDDVNVEACNRLLVSLKRWFKSIFIITHVDSVKDVADNVIDITWTGKDAKIVYT